MLLCIRINFHLAPFTVYGRVSTLLVYVIVHVAAEDAETAAVHARIHLVLADFHVLQDFFVLALVAALWYHTFKSKLMQISQDVPVYGNDLDIVGTVDSIAKLWAVQMLRPPHF